MELSSSAYFPDDHQGRRKEPIRSAGLVPSDGNKPIRGRSDLLLSFPLHRQVLWNRAVKHNSKFTLSANDVIPSLIIPASSVRQLLTLCGYGSNFDQIAYISSLNSVKDDPSLASVLQHPVKRKFTSPYLLKLEDGRKAINSSTHQDICAQLTIPFLVSSSAPSSSSSSSSSSAHIADRMQLQNLLTNLGKSIRMNAVFAMKSIIRLRALVNTHHGTSRHNHSAASTLR